jgi:hypothetical protein
MTATNCATIPVPTPIHLATADDGGGRFTFSHPAAFIPAEGDAAWCATDGKMLAVVPFKFADPADDSLRGADGIRIVARDAVRACKRTKRNPLPFVSVNGTAKVAGSDGPEWTSPEGTFPPCADVIPSEHQVGRGVTISLNPELLARLAEALGSGNKVSIVADPDGKRPMVVIPNRPNAVGILMPCSGVSENLKDEAAIRCANAIRIIRAAEARKGGSR